MGYHFTLVHDQLGIKQYSMTQLACYNKCTCAQSSLASNGAPLLKLLFSCLFCCSARALQLNSAPLHPIRCITQLNWFSRFRTGNSLCTYRLDLDYHSCSYDKSMVTMHGNTRPMHGGETLYILLIISALIGVSYIELVRYVRTAHGRE